MLIRNADVWGHGRADVRLVGQSIGAIGALDPQPGERIIEAAGGALLPGLHDHHIHLAALAARAASIACGPPEVATPEDLAAQLDRPGDGWLRGTGYHESVMGLPDAIALDAMVPDRPLRIQHRSGRMWLLNSAALDALLARAPAPPGLERTGNRHTGRLFEEDDWLQQTLGSQPPDFAAVSSELAGYGVTGVTDMSPRNDSAIAAHFTAEIESGALVQRAWLAGNLGLAQAEPGPWRLGAAKLHLHENALPDFDAACVFIDAAHRQNRAVATHCVSEVELVFALAAIAEAGPGPDDRIEHASIANAALVAQVAELGLAVVSQPHFVAERGDRYLLDVEARHQNDLYRLASLKSAGITLAGGSDAPFGGVDPWAAMAAAVSRQTRGGLVIGADEALSPEEALALYLADPEDLSLQRPIAPGAPADLCLLDRPWCEARRRLTADDLRATFIAGRCIHDRVDQSPA